MGGGLSAKSLGSNIMKMFFIQILILFFSFFLISNTYSQIKQYKFISKTDKADFDYPKLNNIDNFLNDSSDIRQAFKEIEGDFIVYQFESEFIGESYNDSSEYFHDILIIKTDVRNLIIDAFQYTLEWKEPPFQYDLYRSTINNFELINNFKLDRLKMSRTYDKNVNDDYLVGKGIIIF